MKLKLPTLVGVIWALLSMQAQAHSLHLFAQYDGQDVSGRAYYSDQSPAADTYFEAYQLGQKGSETHPIASGKTDTDGHFSLPVAGEGPFKIVVEGAEGHRAERVADNVAKRILGRAEFELLREDIQRLKHRIYLHDVIGGIGYIFGLFGIITLFKTRKDKN